MGILIPFTLSLPLDRLPTVFQVNDSGANEAYLTTAHDTS